MTTKVIIFDLWDTLVHDTSLLNINEIAKKLGFKDKGSFFSYCDKHLFNRNITMNDFLEEIVKLRKLDKKILNDVKELWEENYNFVGLYPDVIPTLERLKGKYKLCIISNTSPVDEDHTTVLKKFDLEKYFDEIIFSWKVGLVKPNLRIFKLALEKFNVKPSETCMVGDYFEHDIVPTKLLGMRFFLLDRRGKYPEYQNEKWYIKSLNELCNLV